MEKYLTKNGIEKIKKELEHLENVKRKEVIEKIKHAVSQGDLRENAGYAAAKEEQSFIEGRIKELKSIISQAKVITKTNNEKVHLGSTVYLESKQGKEKYQIVSGEEANILQGKVSFNSPFGRALLAKKQGDVVKINTLLGKSEYKIIKITQE